MWSYVWVKIGNSSDGLYCAGSTCLADLFPWKLNVPVTASKPGWAPPAHPSCRSTGIGGAESSLFRGFWANEVLTYARWLTALPSPGKIISAKLQYEQRCSENCWGWKDLGVSGAPGAAVLCSVQVARERENRRMMRAPCYSSLCASCETVSKEDIGTAGRPKDWFVIALLTLPSAAFLLQNERE